MIRKPSGAPKYGGSITIQDWMVRLYQLQGDNLLIYATIHSFSKDGESVFRGSLRYLAFQTGKSKPTVLKALNYLLTQKLICKKEIQYTRLNQKRHYCEYWTTFSRLDTEEQKKMLSTTKQFKLSTTGQNSLPVVFHIKQTTGKNFFHNR